MAIEELIETLEQKRELLEQKIHDSNMSLNSNEVLAYSRELDKLITAYLVAISKRAMNPN